MGKSFPLSGPLSSSAVDHFWKPKASNPNPLILQMDKLRPGKGGIVGHGHLFNSKAEPGLELGGPKAFSTSHQPREVPSHGERLSSAVPAGLLPQSVQTLVGLSNPTAETAGEEKEAVSP